MKKFVKRLLGLTLAACMVMSATTASAARQEWSATEPVSISTMDSGDTNLALGKSVTANEVEPGTQFTADLAVDGDTTTRWASDAMKNTPGDKWLRVDFGEEITFDTVNILWEQLNILHYRLEVSNDISSEDNWTTIYESDSRISTKDESILLPQDATGRYLRVYVTDCDGAESNWDSVSIFELGVYYSGGSSEPEEPTGNYVVYPVPQKVTDSEETVQLTDTIHVIKEEGIDTVTQNRVEEVLTEHGYAVEYSDIAVEGETNLYIGINGSGGAADTYAGIPKDVFTEGENKYDMHVVEINENGDIVILGKDNDAAFYGLATLEQVLDQAEDHTLKVSLFEDYSNQKYRGAVEGYYGYPWSVDGTLSWMDYAKRYKMNIFLYGPKSDPYHLGKWKEEYPVELTEEEKAHGVLSQDDIRQITAKAAECNVDFVWVAHPAMQNGINFGSTETIDQGVQDLMAKFDHMYDLGVREFGVFLDDIPYGSATGTGHAYLIDQVQKKLYETYNTEGTAPEDQIKPLFFTPTYYTVYGASSSYLSAFRNIHEDVVICFTGNDVFSDISNADAAQYEEWIGREPCLWWNYPVNDNDDNVFYTCPIDSFYSQDSDISNFAGIISNPMNFEEASKVAFFAIADYSWNPGAFNAQQNWNHCFDSIIPDDPEMAEALKVVYGSLNKRVEPMKLRKLYNQYKSEAGTGSTEAAVALRDKMVEIIDSIRKIESLKDSENPSYRLLVSEAQTSMNKLYDMAVTIKGVLNATLETDPLTIYQGYYSAKLAYDRLNIVENPRYEMTSLEGAGEEITVNKLSAVPSDTYMRPFVDYIIGELDTVELPDLDPSLAGVKSVTITSGENQVKQGETGQYSASVVAEREDAVEVVWSVEGNTDKTTTISSNGLLTMGKNELAQEITVRATSAYDPSKSDTTQVTVVDRVYEDPTIPTNVAFNAVVLGSTGDPTGVEVPERALDENEETKWCPGSNTKTNQWMAIDLGATKTISQWKVVHAGSEGAAYITRDFSLQVLKDPNATEEQLKDPDYLGDDSNWKTIKHITNNNNNLTDITFEEPIEGRYFRLFVADGGSGSYPATRIYEWQMMGVDTEIVSQTYNLSVDPAIEHGSIQIESAHYQAGARVNLQIVPEEGYQLKAGSLQYNGNEITDNRFIMPEEDVVITAEFEPISSTETYQVTVSATENGEVTVNPTEAEAGTVITVTVSPEEGYRLVEGSLKANGVVIENNQFIMPAEDVTVTAEFEKIPVQVITKVLEKVLEKAEFLWQSGALENTMEAVVTEFQNAVEAGKQLLADPSQATQEQINDATERLLKVMGKVDWKQGDKTVLQVAVEIARVIYEDIDLYVEEGKQEFLDALARGEELLSSGNAWDDEIQEAADRLIEAMSNLRMAPNKDILNDMIKQAGSIDLSLYTADSTAALKGAVAQARAVAADVNADQGDIDAAVESLQAALKGLILNQPSGENSETVTVGEGAIPTKTGDSGSSMILVGLIAAAGAVLVLSRKNRR